MLNILGALSHVPSQSSSAARSRAEAAASEFGNDLILLRELIFQLGDLLVFGLFVPANGAGAFEGLAGLVEELFDPEVDLPGLMKPQEDFTVLGLAG